MKILYYVLSAFFGLIGILGVLGTVDYLANGGRFGLGLLAVPLLALLIAIACLRRALAAA